MRHLMAILLIVAIGPIAVPAADSTIKTLVLTGESDLPYHHWRQSTPFLREVLERTGRFEGRVCEDPNGINRTTLYNKIRLYGLGARPDRSPVS